MNLNKILKMIVIKKLFPVIVFSFSKKEVEAFAMGITEQDLNDVDDKEVVEEIFNSAIDSLAEEDKQLP